MTKVLALCERRIGGDWLAHFDQPLLLLETFVDTARYHGTLYRAANTRERFGCRIENRQRLVPSESIIRDVLIRVDPDALDRALQRWNVDYGQTDDTLAIDGKTMCNAIDADGRQTHIMSVVGHATAQCYTQKKSAPCP